MKVANSNRITNFVASFPVLAIKVAAAISASKVNDTSPLPGLTSELNSLDADIKKLRTSTCTSTDSWNIQKSNIGSRLINLNNQIVHLQNRSNATLPSNLIERLGTVNGEFIKLSNRCPSSSAQGDKVQNSFDSMLEKVRKFFQNVPPESGGY